MAKQKKYNHLGYFTEFLGPELKIPVAKKGVLVPLLVGRGNELKYTHFSVFVHNDRKLPLMTAVNIKGEAYTQITRDGNEPWDFSDQIKKEFQVDNRFYSKDDNTFDRGHLVRRIDPCWGGIEIATVAENETFRWVNCTPQHKKLNQKGGVWYQLEQHIMENGVKDKLTDVSVFAGPVLSPTDKIFVKKYLNADIQIPTLYWKVIVWQKSDKKLYAVGFMMDQTEWIGNKLIERPAPLETKKKALPSLPDDYFEKLEFNDNKTYQVRLKDIEDATGIKFNWSNVNLPFKGIKPKAVKAKPLEKVYSFDVYLRSKMRLSISSGKSINTNNILKEIESKGHAPLTRASIGNSLKNGYGGALKQYELSNISL